MKNPTIRSLLFIGAISAASIAVAHPQDAHQNPMLQTLKQLDLGAQQKQDVKALMRQAKADRAVFKADQQAFRQAMKDIVQAEDWQPELVEQLLAQHAEQHKSALRDRADLRHNIWLLLTPEQQTEFMQLARPQDKERPDWSERLPHMAEKLSLSDEQQAVMQTLLQETSQVIAPLKQQLQALRAQERALIQATEFDVDAWEALFNEYQPVQQQITLNRTYLQHQMFNQLNEAQQDKLEALMQRKRRRG
ncbi:Spy/CpxP family protein refolding chaperone [Alteromonas flava]|uniref:Spy/CpxP family protein refolding chaperone n=1 Tax=Alteromonas flava TaxID=2048003 RepID=UPI000C2952CF|nr:Spy/CpxP family protein refolding chaperone [Alteromonas flava]